MMLSARRSQSILRHLSCAPSAAAFSTSTNKQSFHGGVNKESIVTSPAQKQKLIASCSTVIDMNERQSCGVSLDIYIYIYITCPLQRATNTGEKRKMWSSS